MAQTDRPTRRWSYESTEERDSFDGSCCGAEFVFEISHGDEISWFVMGVTELHAMNCQTLVERILAAYTDLDGVPR